MPCSQGGKGRDHNPSAFTSWLAGGGVKGGVGYGASDEWSYKARGGPDLCYDLHATVLHLLGIDHTRLTFQHNGIDRRLTDVHGAGRSWTNCWRERPLSRGLHSAEIREQATGTTQIP